MEILENRFEILKTLNTGHFGIVKLANDCQIKTKVAIKFAYLTKNYEVSYKMIIKEALTLESLHHENVIKFCSWKKENERAYIIMEYIEGPDLKQYVSLYDRLTDNSGTASIFKQIVNAIDYIHTKGYVHLDIKPENVMLDKNQQVKIIDFGLSENVGYENRLCSNFKDVLGCNAPEVLQSRNYDGFKADIWSYGILLYFCLAGKLPFSDGDFIDETITEEQVSNILCSLQDIRESTKGFLKQILQVDPYERPTIKDIKSNPWFL